MELIGAEAVVEKKALTSQEEFHRIATEVTKVINDETALVDNNRCAAKGDEITCPVCFKKLVKRTKTSVFCPGSKSTGKRGCYPTYRKLQAINLRIRRRIQFVEDLITTVDEKLEEVERTRVVQGVHIRHLWMLKEDVEKRRKVTANLRFSATVGNLVSFLGKQAQEQKKLINKSNGKQNSHRCPSESTNFV